MEAYKEKGGGILSLPCGFGKCMGKDTPIMMFNGTIKMIQDIQVGDIIMGDDSTPRNVLSLARGRENMYKVIPEKGDSYIVNESHILSLKYNLSYDPSLNKDTSKGTVVDISILDYLNLPKSDGNNDDILVGYRVPVQFQEKSVHIDPYRLGYLLGNDDDTIMEDSILKDIQNNHRLKHKHIPHIYKCNHKPIQYEVLAGIIDSCGVVQKNGYLIIQKNEELLDDIIFIARSLGFASYKSVCHKENDELTYQTLIYGEYLEKIPVKCFKQTIKETKDVLNTPIKIEKLEVDDYYGFMIDGNHRYLLGDFTVTHNTILGLYFISQLKKKALVIVHKEFLMNQWIERIQFALPQAKIGIVQGNKCEIEGSDIIIGMLQTLSMKDFPKDTFDDIGHVLIDECHRIPSRVFMKALFKINCKYMLGLSATPNRKDGCTKILKWFIGDIIYSVKSSEKNIVKVDRYLINSDDQTYNNELFNFRGQVQISSMVTQIVNYLKRTAMVVEKIVEELDKNEARQFLILSDRKQQLEDFNRLLKEAGVESVGYYVGGMKQKDLKKSESCRVLLGTFPMANEGLDIPSLNGLILATPKSDIIQSVGRICRIKHENIQPLIIDLVDRFSVFENQSRKRFTLYKKNKYEIEDIKYDMDKNEIFLRKRYDFHHIFEKECDTLTQTKIDLNKTDVCDKKDKKSKNNDYKELFESMDLFFLFYIILYYFILFYIILYYFILYFF